MEVAAADAVDGFPLKEAREALGTPTVSIIVPTRNRRTLLERKLRSLEGEEKTFEVIVVADDCTDDTEEFLTHYQPPYPFSWTTGPGRHAATARNIGATRARGEVLLFSDDDGIPSPGWVRENRLLHERAGSVGLSKLVLPPHLSSGVTLGRVRGWWSTNGCSISMRAELFNEIGGYDERFSTYGGEDADLGWRLKQARARFVLLSRAPVEHWDEGYGQALEEKAESAGAAHVRVWRKHGTPRVAWVLGVHPLLLAAKRVLLGPWAAPFLGREQYRYEVAYAAGAREEHRRA